MNRLRIALLVALLLPLTMGQVAAPAGSDTTGGGAGCAGVGLPRFQPVPGPQSPAGGGDLEGIWLGTSMRTASVSGPDPNGGTFTVHVEPESGPVELKIGVDQWPESLTINAVWAVGFPNGMAGPGKGWFNPINFSPPQVGQTATYSEKVQIGSVSGSCDAAGCGETPVYGILASTVTTREAFHDAESLHLVCDVIASLTPLDDVAKSIRQNQSFYGSLEVTGTATFDLLRLGDTLDYQQHWEGWLRSTSRLAGDGPGAPFVLDEVAQLTRE